MNPYYNNWYNGCWSGNWGGGYGNPYAFGATTWGLASLASGWGLGYSSLGYGGGYVNPYYSAIPATVTATSPYDYSQPIVVNNYVTNDGDLTSTSDNQGGAGGVGGTGGQGGNAAATQTTAASEANRVFDEALARFKAADYASALAGCDKAVKLSPKDSVIHEVRALTLFALGRYPEAAAALNSVLAVAPGMDWTTLSSLYGSVDTYTGQLRKLEEFCKTNPTSAAGHFVLAYHYLVGGYADLASEALKVVVAQQPSDLVAKRLLDALTPAEELKAPEEPAAEAKAAPAAEQAQAPAGPETDLVGVWLATAGKDTITLTVTEDSRFTWKATPAGKPAVELSGEIGTSTDEMALQTEKNGTMVGKVVSKGPDAFEFLLSGAPKDAKPLAFERQK